MSRTIEVQECTVCGEMWTEPAVQCQWHDDEDHARARDYAAMRAVRAVLTNADLVRWLDRYGDGPPYLQGDEGEVIWRLAGYLNAARTALGVAAPVSVETPGPEPEEKP